MSYGHALKTAGRQERAIAAYRRCIALDPAFRRGVVEPGQPQDLALRRRPTSRAMRAQLARADLTDEHRLHFEFALGKALEDAGDYDGVVRALRATATRCAARWCPTAPTTTPRACARARARLHPRILRRTRGLGLRRARSDLHRRHAARRLDADRADPVQPLRGRRHDGTARDHLAGTRACAGARTPHDARPTTTRSPGWTRTSCARSASSTCERTRIHRKRGAPFFIDKMPNNFAHIGLIQLVLPNAKIIDARRHPLALLLVRLQAAFRPRPGLQLFDSTDIGRYYRDYVELMAHFDAVLPGRVHRVIYEDMVADTEAEVRRLLDYCGLPFDDACLRFFENHARGAHRELGTGAPADLPRAASTSGATTNPGSNR